MPIDMPNPYESPSVAIDEVGNEREHPRRTFRWRLIGVVPTAFLGVACAIPGLLVAVAMPLQGLFQGLETPIDAILEATFVAFVGLIFCAAAFMWASARWRLAVTASVVGIALLIVMRLTID